MYIFPPKTDFFFPDVLSKRNQLFNFLILKSHFDYFTSVVLWQKYKEKTLHLMRLSRMQYFKFFRPSNIHCAKFIIRVYFSCVFFTHKKNHQIMQFCHFTLPTKASSLCLHCRKAQEWPGLYRRIMLCSYPHPALQYYIYTRVYQSTAFFKLFLSIIRWMLSNSAWRTRRFFVCREGEVNNAVFWFRILHWIAERAMLVLQFAKWHKLLWDHDGMVWYGHVWFNLPTRMLLQRAFLVEASSSSPLISFNHFFHYIHKLLTDSLKFIQVVWYYFQYHFTKCASEIVSGAWVHVQIFPIVSKSNSVASSPFQAWRRLIHGGTEAMATSPAQRDHCRSPLIEIKSKIRCADLSN